MARRRRNPRGTGETGSGGGISAGTILILGAAAFVFFTPTGQEMINSLGSGSWGGSTAIPAGLPVGTVRLSNGQYRLPTGQVVGAPYAGQMPIAGSSLTWQGVAIQAGMPVLQTAVSGVLGGLRSLFGSVFGGTGDGGATGSGGAAGGSTIGGGLWGNGAGVGSPAAIDPSTGSTGGAGGDLWGGDTLTLSDGTQLVLSPGDFSLWGGDATAVDLPAWWTGGLNGTDPSISDPYFDTGWGGSGGESIFSPTMAEVDLTTAGFDSGFGGFRGFGENPAYRRNVTPLGIQAALSGR